MTSAPMTIETSRRGNIVVGVDGSPTGEHAVLWAAEEAHLHHRGLTVVHAARQLAPHQETWFVRAGVPLDELRDHDHEVADRILQRALSMARDRFPEVGVETILDFGDPRHVLRDLAETAPMIVTGSRGHGRVMWLLLGSVSAALVHHAPCPIAIVRPTGEGRQGVLVGCDGTEESVVPLEFAFAEASARKLPLTVVHCLWEALVGRVRWGHVATSDPEFDEAHRHIARALSGLSEKYPEVPVQVCITRGAIDACLVDLSGQHDLLVIGRPPHSLGERLNHPGLVITLAEHAHAPVVVVP